MSMKILLSTIILIFSLIISIVLIKQYRAPTLSKTTATAETTIQNPVSTPATNIATSPVVSETAVHETAQAVAHSIKKVNNLADLNVKKLISVTSSQGLSPKALKSALNAYSWALKHGKLGSNKDVLTVVDF